MENGVKTTALSTQYEQTLRSDALSMMLGKMALEREATLTSEKLNVFVEGLCELLDTPGYVWSDAVNAIASLGKRDRAEGETAWFDLGTMRAEFKRQATIRRCAAYRADREKQEREQRVRYEAEVAAGENGPDASMRMRMAALEARFTMPRIEPGQPARKYTMPSNEPATPAQPAPPERTLRDANLSAITALHDAMRKVPHEDRTIALRSLGAGDDATLDAMERVLRQYSKAGTC